MQSNTLERFYDQILTELEFCESKQTPYVCSQFGSPDARATLVKTIAETCISMKITIAQAITQVERLYGLNSLD